MAAPWYRAEPDRLSALKSGLAGRYPALRIDVTGPQPMISGLWPVTDENGAIVDEFRIELKLPHSLRHQVPELREVGGRIPFSCSTGNPERHVNPDGTACLLIEEDFWKDHPEGYELMEFLEGPVRHWLLGQVFFEAHGCWPWEEWEHDFRGLFRCYRELFGAPSDAVALEFLKVLVRDQIKGHWRCPCQSGRRLRNCCGEKVRRLHGTLPPELLRRRREWLPLMERWLA